MGALEIFGEVFARGLVIGVVYALMGLGLTLIIGVMRIINFAQGEFYMLGAYFAYYLSAVYGFPFPLAILGATLAVFGVAYLVEKTLISPMRQESVENPMEYSLMITFALSIFLQKMAVLTFGPHVRRPEFLRSMVDFGIVRLQGDWVVAMIVAAALILLVTFYLGRTWRGRGWRAIAQCLPGASIMGININRESSLVFALACLLAGAAGAVLAPITLVFPTVGSSPLVKGYEIMAIGGLGSILGSFIGGLLLGLAEVLGSVYISSAYRDLYGFIILVIFLVVRPRGLFGRA
ncbi:MAG: branched-chain amino acid ABC transporter permease [Thermodesulfobacteriota bacterium]